MQILHNISKQKLELVSNVSDSGVLANSILPILKDTQTIWQPADFLPDPSQESFIEEVLPCQHPCIRSRSESSLPAGQPPDAHADAACRL